MPPRRSTSSKKPTLTPKQIEEQKRHIRQTQACLKIQRILRGIRIRLGMLRVKQIEDLLFELREPAVQVLEAFLAMAATPSETSPEEEDLKVLEASPPDFGIIIPELDTEEEKEEREQVQAEYDAKLAATKIAAEEKKTARDELDQADAAAAEGQVITMRAFIRELQRRGFQSDATKATVGVFSVLAAWERDPVGISLNDLLRLRAHKLRRIIMSGPTKQLILILVRHGEADYLADKLVLEKHRPLTEQGIMQAATAGQNIAIHKCNPDIILSSTSQRCLETAKWIQELAPREWLFSTCKALDQKEDPTGRLGPSIFPVADAIISAAQAYGNIFTVCLVTNGMLLETMASCLAFQSDDIRDSVGNRILCGDVVILKSKGLNIAEGEDLTERSADDLWMEAMQSERWSVVEHMRGDGEPDPATPRPVDDSTRQWYHYTTDMAWTASIGDPLIYTDENLAYPNHYSGSNQPQESKVTPGLRLLVAGYESPREMPMDPREVLDAGEDDYEDVGEDGIPEVRLTRKQTLSESSRESLKEASRDSLRKSSQESYRKSSDEYSDMPE